jgi:2-keto-3-deoxy-L-rhamnonate aldolase RhmA
MERVERFREQLGTGSPMWGTFLVELLAPGVPQILSIAGFNFVVIDGEHGTYSPEQMRHLIDASRAAHITPFVRVPMQSAGAVTQLLDAGAAGIFFPLVRTMEQVREAVALTKYPPLGRRGVHMFRPHTNFSTPADQASYMRRANRSLVTAIQIETPEAVEMIDSIAATDGIDMLYVGPSDLSVNLGLVGQPQAPRIRSIIKDVARVCRTHSKIAGCHVTDSAAASELRDEGYCVFGYAAASRLLMQGAQAFIATTRRGTRPPPSLTVEVTSSPDVAVVRSERDNPARI